MAAISPANIVKFDGFGNFGLWQRRVKDVLVQQGLVKALTTRRNEGHRVARFGNEGCVDYQDVLGR